jgi:predicted DNA-binding protein (MmcQ/YjbR family)
MPRAGAKRPLDRLRAICLALPEAVEKETWDLPTFRVRDKIFAMAIIGETPLALWCKAPPGSQAILVGADARRFFVPPYVGHKGWVGMRLGSGVDWREVAVLATRSYRLTAPKRIAALLGESSFAGEAEDALRGRGGRGRAARASGRAISARGRASG